MATDSKTGPRVAAGAAGPGDADGTTAPGAVTAEHHFPCAQCGGEMRFSPGEGKLVCDHCGNTVEVAETRRGGAIPETDFRKGLALALPDSEIAVSRYSRCPNCGAEVEFDPAVHSTECPFCATPVVADTGDTRHIKPKGVAPFVVTEAAARDAMTRWLGSLWFAPSGLTAYARNGRAMQGIYVPYWTFDAQTRSDYSGQRGTVYYTTEPVQVRDGNGQVHTEMRQVAHVRWTAVSGHVQRFFDDVLVLASQSLPQDNTAALEPWDLSRLEPYQPEYLAGFRSEGYTVPLDAGMQGARAFMDRMIERDVRFDIGGDRQQVDGIETQLSAVTFKHVLLPVWMAAYKFRGRSFRFVVNGQTGKVQGERPWSVAKIVAAALLVAALTAIVVYVGEQNGWFRNIASGSGGFQVNFGN